jgi:hypothetical protein
VALGSLGLLLSGCGELIDAGRYLIEDGDHYSISGDEVRWVSYRMTGVFPWPGMERSVSTVEEADSRTFHILENPVFARDAKTVFFKGSPLAGADVGSFRILQVPALVIQGGEDARTGFEADARHAWSNGKLIEGADGASFRVLRGHFAADARRVYYNWDPITGADPASFRVLSSANPLGVDRKAVWNGIIPLPLPDTSQVRGLGDQYWTDGKDVYWRQSRMEGADIGSFRVLDGVANAEDRRGRWNGPNRVPNKEQAR